MSVENYVNRPVLGYTSYKMKYSYSGIPFDGGEPVMAQIGSQTKVGVKNPYYLDQIEHLVDATTGYNRIWFEETIPGWMNIRVRKLNSSDFLEVRGFWRSSVPDPTDQASQDAVIKDIAVAKIKAKIQSDKEDYAVLTNLTQDVYEFQRTIHGTLDSIRDLLREVQFLLGLRRTMGKRGLLRGIADLYLAWTFGINPTIQDAKELAKSIDSYVKRKDHVKRFTASHHGSSTNSRKSTIRPFVGLTLNVTETMSRRIGYKYVSGHKLDLRTGNNYGLFDHFHLAPTDFVPMLWEILPWSWLIDYVFNVGEYLDDHFQSTVNTSYYNVQNYKISKVFTVKIEAVADKGWVFDRKVIVPSLVDTGQLNRIKLAQLPGRILRLHTPYEIDKNLPKKLLNIMAVMATKSLH